MKKIKRESISFFFLFLLRHLVKIFVGFPLLYFLPIFYESHCLPCCSFLQRFNITQANTLLIVVLIWRQLYEMKFIWWPHHHPILVLTLKDGMQMLSWFSQNLDQFLRQTQPTDPESMAITPPWKCSWTAHICPCYSN